MFKQEYKKSFIEFYIFFYKNKNKFNKNNLNFDFKEFETNIKAIYKILVLDKNKTIQKYFDVKKFNSILYSIIKNKDKVDEAIKNELEELFKNYIQNGFKLRLFLQSKLLNKVV